MTKHAISRIGFLLAGLAWVVASDPASVKPGTPSTQAKVDLLSLEACRAEFRWLDAHWRQLDLRAAPVQTDGWTTNIPQAEWPVMGLSYHAYAAANLAKADQRFRGDYLDTATGMFSTYVFPKERRSLQGPRGISQMYGLHFLRDFAPEFAGEQYALARRHLFTSVLGIPGVREFPEGMLVTPDVDSGPLVFGMGPSASGFAVAASATMGERELAANLARAAGVVGMPVMGEGKLTYALMPAVGQGVILYGKSLLLLNAGDPSR